ncbi:MAG TPA: TIR domain-containing protein, partial [Ktedonobacterales bacterium]|nr:TIR domain-containing protein [Ktedonobacterales bacterium]
MAKSCTSYRRAESTDIAGRLRDHLAGRLPNDSNFMDVDTIPPGADFRTIIERAIIQSTVLLLVIGPSWLSPASANSVPRQLDVPNDVVRAELEIALHWHIPLITLLV